ncbi:UDP-2,3-diacylglucosamine diphosphatase [Ideonella sp. TBM-1]|uniref:UDP-2,3-diacylglucosamine hydrolase n=2 Tax=Ideonella livida TaxID=2707176 RepID=A0A7C9THP5_9BURK|nr:UDP-2,3-diacylglucosamine diphosphatase [Ideonella livida]
MPRTAAAWQAHLAHTRADALIILGDLFEAWVGDDAGTQAFEASMLASLASYARRGRLGLMRGNRDFLLSRSLAAGLGGVLLDDPCQLLAQGHRWLLSHGDAWCLADQAYQAVRPQLRSLAWQRDFLSKPLTQRLAMAAAMRHASEAHHRAAARAEDPLAYADVDADTACRALREADAQVLVHGHTHRPGHTRWPAGLSREVLSDWDLDTTDRPRAEVLVLENGLLRREVPQAG